MSDYCQMCGQFHPLTTGGCLQAQNFYQSPAVIPAPITVNLPPCQRCASLERELAEARGIYISQDKHLKRLCVDLAALRLNLISMQKFTDEIKAENAALKDDAQLVGQLTDSLAALTKRHAEAVEKAYREAARRYWTHGAGHALAVDVAWLASEAKKGLGAWARREP